MKNGAAFIPRAAPTEYVDEELPPPPEEEYPEPAAYPEEPVSPQEPPEDPEPAPEHGQTGSVPADAGKSRNVSWREIAEQAASTLPMDVRMRLDDAQSVRGRLEASILRLEVVPGFLYGRFNKPEVLGKFSEAASNLAGHEIRTVLSELTDDPGASKRSLEDLKEFKEVRFV